MMTKLMKILPMLAIVVGIGGAFGFANVQADCEKEDLIGYDYAGPGVPTDPPAIQLGLTQIPGNFNQDYFCDEQTEPTCRWVYTENEEWVRCSGNRF